QWLPDNVTNASPFRAGAHPEGVAMTRWNQRLKSAALIWLLVFVTIPAHADRGPESPAAYKPEEIEALVAPIALYPDPVLAQVLMASTYPLDIVHAARWVKANPTVKGD